MTRPIIIIDNTAVMIGSINGARFVKITTRAVNAVEIVNRIIEYDKPALDEFRALTSPPDVIHLNALNRKYEKEASGRRIANTLVIACKNAVIAVLLSICSLFCP